MDWRDTHLRIVKRLKNGNDLTLEKASVFKLFGPVLSMGGATVMMVSGEKRNIMPKHRYDNGFLHAKTMVIDGQISSVGSKISAGMTVIWRAIRKNVQN